MACWFLGKVCALDGELSDLGDTEPHLAASVANGHQMSSDMLYSGLLDLLCGPEVKIAFAAHAPRDEVLLHMRRRLQRKRSATAQPGARIDCREC